MKTHRLRYRGDNWVCSICGYALIGRFSDDFRVLTIARYPVCDGCYSREKRQAKLEKAQRAVARLEWGGGPLTQDQRRRISP